MSYVRALISATSDKEAKKLVRFLVKLKLIAGALITAGEALYWWENHLIRKTYWNISAFSKKTLTKKIISEVKKIHSDAVPIVSFYSIVDANKDFLVWIHENTIRK